MPSATRVAPTVIFLRFIALLLHTSVMSPGRRRASDQAQRRPGIASGNLLAGERASPAARRDARRPRVAGQPAYAPQRKPSSHNDAPPFDSLRGVNPANTR